MEEQMKTRYPLHRFLRQQKQMYAVALQELQAGEKESHWMWYIFPQWRGLGESPMAYNYGIIDLEEARAYLDHPVLGARLTECCETLLTHKDKSVEDIFDDVDAMKLRSSMTLFQTVAGENSVFSRVLEQFFDGQPDQETERRVRDTKYFIIINGRLFSCIGTEDDVVIPEGVLEISQCAFSKYENLRSVTLPRSLIEVHDFAFAYQEKLSRINMPRGVKRIGRCAFKGCKALADEDGFVIIRHMIHDYCGNGKFIEIPEGVATIGYEAFRGNKDLLEVTIPDSVTAISGSAFENCPNLTLRVAEGSYAERYAHARDIPYTIY